jgi:hypothetical protein
MDRERGSILVLTLIGVLILSLMATGLLTVGSTEVNTTQNFYLNKFAYYTALQGIEEIRYEMTQTSYENVSAISKSPSDTLMETDGVQRYYITGSLYHLQKNEPQSLQQDEGFPPHQPTGLSIGVHTRITPIAFRIVVTAEAAMGRRKGYSQIEAGIFSLVPID